MMKRLFVVTIIVASCCTLHAQNAGASFLFLKEDKGQIKLSVYDLLNQNVIVYRYNFENIISEGQSTTLHRYFMISFIYNIRNFSGGKVGGRDRTFGFF